LILLFLLNVSLVTSQYGPVIDVSNLNGNNGIYIGGADANDPISGYAGTLGDFTGDGIDDFVVRSQSKLYLIFGKKVGSWPLKFDLTTLNGNNGFVIEGLVSLYVGGPVTSGDFNGDGKSDLVSLDARKLYVIFGQAANSWPAKFDLTTLHGTNGFSTVGISASQVGAGDFNGDGKADIIVGNCWANPGGRNAAGAAYVFFGQASPMPPVLNLTSLNGNNGFVIEGLNDNDWFGLQVRSAGDINADGKEDMVIGAPGYNQPTNRAYVILGQASGWPATISLTSLNGANGFAISSGVPEDDAFGWWVSTVGDFNGDGKDDFAVGAENKRYGYGAPLPDAGSSYVIFGQSGVWPAFISLLDTLNGTNGFIVNGFTANDQLGNYVGTAGDLNGDGKDDFVVASSHSITPNKGYVIFGQSSGLTSHFDLRTLNGKNGFSIAGPDNYLNLFPNIGDINGDGKDDFVVTTTDKPQDYLIFRQ
jgi:hypothetical protein